jgi:hypothetical protein|tara:strand:- start:2100 stop:2225 length:126 start_codon:yes stop_codon:yes gene_type:complete
MAIYNEIFEHYRLEELKINQAIQLLEENGYKIFLEKKDKSE